MWLSKLEELDDIFNSKSPVKTSIEKKKLDVDANANIVHVDVLANSGHGVVWAQQPVPKWQWICLLAGNITISKTLSRSDRESVSVM